MSAQFDVSEAPRARAGRWIESGPVQRFIIVLILVNAAILGLETNPEVMTRMGPYLLGADRIILGVFVLEILTRLYAHGLRFFRNPWNVFDFLVVGIALFPASGPFAVLRILRLLRLVSMIPKLRFVVEALLRAIPGIASIFGLLAILFYVFAVIATGLFAENHPEWFGDLGRSMYTLFQVMTLESWSMGIARPVMESHPYAWLFFIPFILVATFTILNLFIAIIVNTMQSLQEEQQRFEEETITTVVHAESDQLHQDLSRMEHENLQLHRDLRALHAEIRALREHLRDPRP
jgi:voltage-gated sodium channel